jgi:hypothetical protein
MKGTTLYKKRLSPSEDGLEIITDKWVCIHETPCFYFCVPDRVVQTINALKRKDETILAYAKRCKYLKRINKDNSRFAFTDEGAALEHLRLLKRKQLGHMKRDMEFIECFLAADDLEPGRYGEMVPDSKELVNSYFVFD